MTHSHPASVGIIGAGSMGILTGYHLSLAGADVTFLVRPHRREQLSRPQRLYSFDDNDLKPYTGYELLTDPAGLTGSSFDFVVVTLDGAALRAEPGQKVVDEIGRAFRGTSTAVILGSVGIDQRTWFLERSGLADAQVTNGGLGMWAYEAQRADMPLHDGVSADLLAQADYGYRHLSPTGFVVDLSAPQVAHEFAALYNSSGVSHCAELPIDAHKLIVSVSPASLAWELLGWPAAKDIDTTDETWQLGVEAVKEFRRLSVFGPAGIAASEETTAENVLEVFRQAELAALPMDATAFIAYHHGSKLAGQGNEVLDEAVRRGETEGAEMPALRALLKKLPH
jgi:hypothetical protein